MSIEEHGAVEEQIVSNCVQVARWMERREMFKNGLAVGALWVVLYVGYQIGFYNDVMQIPCEQVQLYNSFHPQACTAVQDMHRLG